MNVLTNACDESSEACYLASLIILWQWLAMRLAGVLGCELFGFAVRVDDVPAGLGGT